MYKNYGDKNFFEYGRLVDDKHSDTEFPILYCSPYEGEEDRYQFAELTVDITDNWIDWDMVEETCGKSTDPIIKALNAVDYYGPENFGVYNYMVFHNWTRMTKKEIIKILDNELIDWNEVEANIE